MGRDTPWLQIFNRRDKVAARLLCFPFAGGGAQSFSSWPNHLPEDFELWAVQLPGRETRMRELPMSDVNALIDEMLPAILPTLEKPFFLFGHSMGALIAYELARAVQKKGGRAPECLIVSGRVAPHRKSPRSPINTLPQDEFVAALKLLNGTPREVLENSDLLALITPMLRADFALNETYEHVPGPRLNCDIVAFGGLRDPEVGRQAIDDWAEVTDGNFSLRMVPGDHFFIRTAEKLFLHLLAVELYRAMNRSPGHSRETSVEARSDCESQP